MKVSFALHELQRLQAARQGEAFPAPVALDITTDLVAQPCPQE